MQYLQCKKKKLAGSDYGEISRAARVILREIEHRTKRQSYVRSVYFSKEKIFLNYFWPHLDHKSKSQRLSRLVYLPCALELITNSRFSPTVKCSEKDNYVLYRFIGITPNQELFCIQIKESGKKKQKHLLSVFPWK